MPQARLPQRASDSLANFNEYEEESKEKPKVAAAAFTADDDEEENWLQQMSPRFLNQVINEMGSRVSDAELETRHNFENQTFINQLFRVEFYQRKPDYTAVMELKLSPPMDQYRQPILNGFLECPILFKMSLRGRWAI